MPGFTLLINGAVLLSGEGGGPVSSRAEINDWMVSGNNEIMVDLFWPEAVRFVPGSTARFRLFANDTPIKDFRWPASGVSDNLGSGNYTFKENFKADGFPRVQLERAERVISSAGVLPRGDQNEITALAENLRRAFTEKNISGIDSLFRTKYTDLAMARFTSPTTLRNRADASYQELMNKEAYAVRPFTGRYSFFSIADGRAVRLVQGRIGFPEPALVINYRENGKAARYDLDLYFAKIDGKWVIIR
ncbi:hypothetical protein AGMMS50230_12300 [Spirochaetia bacterium]|nr:hypothetical protein AGMMS50230_12300 [Spirochaetia bacterium]